VRDRPSISIFLRLRAEVALGALPVRACFATPAATAPVREPDCFGLLFGTAVRCASRMQNASRRVACRPKVSSLRHVGQWPPATEAVSEPLPSIPDAGPVPALSPLIDGESRTVTVGEELHAGRVGSRRPTRNSARLLISFGRTRERLVVHVDAQTAGGEAAGRRCPADAGVYAVDVRPAELLLGDVGKPAVEGGSAD
jgi:hypothetical protein